MTPRKSSTTRGVVPPDITIVYLEDAGDQLCSLRRVVDSRTDDWAFGPSIMLLISVCVENSSETRNPGRFLLCALT
jgi:hypothetical protein